MKIVGTQYYDVLPDGKEVRVADFDHVEMYIKNSIKAIKDRYPRLKERRLNILFEAEGTQKGTLEQFEYYKKIKNLNAKLIRESQQQKKAIAA